MKKISFNLRIGIIGAFKNEKKALIKFLKKQALKSEGFDDSRTDNQLPLFLILYENIPIKLRVFFFEDCKSIIESADISESFDIIIKFAHTSEELVLNDKNNPLKELDKELPGDVSYILVGREVSNLDKAIINRTSLIHYAKKLGFLYCFLIHNIDTDFYDIFKKLLDDLIFKFQYSSPEILERAKKYGKTL